MWNKKDIKDAISVDFTDDFQGKKISIDTRTIEKGDIFLALKGENFDGHLFIQEALDKGASAIIAEREVKGATCLNYAIVENSYYALESMAKYKRSIFQGRVIAITGSVGKTTTKEMLALALQQYGKVSFTYKNQNNNLGTILNLANLDIKSDFAILEIGMSGAGEIAKSVQFVKPDIAIITSVNLAHSEFFANLQEIANAKLEIINENPKTLILNMDNCMFEYLHEKALSKGITTIIRVGSSANADVMVEGCKVCPSLQKMEMSFKIGSEKLEYILASYNKNYSILAGLCLATLKNLGLELKQDLFRSFNMLEGRGQIIKTKNYTLIDDSYNANPCSMQEAIKGLKIFSGRKILILGEMLEIGKGAEDAHFDLVPIILNIKPYKVFASGFYMCKMLHKLPQEIQGVCEKDIRKLTKDVLNYISQGDVVFVKGSFSSNVHQVVNVLKNSEV